jgi:hypothetical protein
MGIFCCTWREAFAPSERRRSSCALWRVVVRVGVGLKVEVWGLAMDVEREG